MLEIISQSGTYGVEEIETLEKALASALQSGAGPTFVLADAKVVLLHPEVFRQVDDSRRLHKLDASEEAKSFAALEPVICSLIEAGIKRNSSLVVVGGGVLQDIGCFIASILFRGLSWSLIPTTLLAVRQLHRQQEFHQCRPLQEPARHFPCPKARLSRLRRVAYTSRGRDPLGHGRDHQVTPGRRAR